MEGSCEGDDESSCYIKGGEFLNQLGNCHLLRKKMHESYGRVIPMLK
jgi:hypothetical protein